jgi:hypothetical protein
MDTSLELRPGRLYLILAPRQAGRRVMTELTARLAVAGDVRVLDAGNWFEAHAIARLVRRQTTLGSNELQAALERVKVARAFTCYQVIALLEQSLDGPTPTLVLNLLSTFMDESVPLVERERLLGQATAHLRRLSRIAPVAVSAAPPPASADELLLPPPYHGEPGGGPPDPSQMAAMVTSLEEAADQVLHFLYPEQPVQGRFL